MPDSFPPLLDAWYLTGPTASGKTAVGVELARRIDAEIISLDSMAVYRGLDVGTAKPTTAERAAVPHHLLDLLSPDEDFSIAQYVTAAHETAAAIRARGHMPLFVGGTPLYLKTLLRGLFIGPAADWPLRRELQALAERDGPEVLHARLRDVDPATAAKLHANDQRRIIRALEVFQLTGRPISAHQSQFDRAGSAAESRVFVLRWPIATLHERIAARVDVMFAAGLVDEVRRVLDAGKSFSRTANQGVGYREVLEYLGRLPTDPRYPPLAGDLAATKEAVARHTRQLAKRQMTWFRSLAECRWIDAAGRSPGQIAAEIAAAGPAPTLGPSR